jgi:hypothetical protein
MNFGESLFNLVQTVIGETRSLTRSIGEWNQEQNVREGIGISSECITDFLYSNSELSLNLCNSPMKVEV